MSREGPWAMHVDIHSDAAAAATFTNMPSEATFLFDSHRHVVLVNTQGFSQVRLKVNKQAVAGAAGSKLLVRYSPSFSTDVSTYRDIGVNEVSVPVSSVNTFLDSGYIDINPDTLGGDVYIAIVGTGGNGTAGPQFGQISVSFS